VTRIVLIALLALAFPISSSAGPAWKLEKGENPVLSAFTETFKSNLNIQAIGFACEEASGVKALQLQIYTKGGRPLAPTGFSRGQLKDEPRAQFVVDGQTFPVTLDFAGDYALLTDNGKGVFPMLSDDIVRAVVSGKTLTLRFDLRKRPPASKDEFDSEAVVDLVSGATAIAAVRQRCSR
jgi:hypothetical protein